VDVGERRRPIVKQQQCGLSDVRANLGIIKHGRAELLDSTLTIGRTPRH
jgi:hypothetical protein